MYNSIQMSDFDGHTHRFLWRDLGPEIKLEYYMLKTVTFGDKPGDQYL